MDAEIVTRGSRIPKICALCVFILAVSSMRDFAPEIFSKVRTLYARTRSKGSPIFPER